MKKKGLIVATIVMVLVLAVSLTTATYAWFTVSDATSIAGFGLSVTAGNAINIGFNASTYTEYNANVGPDSFVSGDCTYVKAPGNGQFATGHWTGTAGLGATLKHDIQWGAQSKAVGFTTAQGADTDISKAIQSSIGFATKDATAVVKANGVAQTSISGVAYATANRYSESTEDEGNGDYVYMWLGAQPTKLLANGTNKLYIVVQVQGTGTAVGMAAAIHVAYRKNSAINGGEWTDVDVFGAENTGTEYSYNTLKANLPVVTIYGNYASQTDIEGGIATRNGEGYYQTRFSNAAVVEIGLTDYNASSLSAPLDQIQLLIYIAGTDNDCRDEAKAGEIGVGIFFGAQEYVAPTQNPGT